MIGKLSDELIAKIIDYNESIADVAVCRLVCKHWNHIAEPLMFGKQITVSSNEDALSLYGGAFIDALLERLVDYIFTPNMEEMTGEISVPYAFFHPIIKIAKGSRAKFKKLQVLPHPVEFSSIYDEALITFRDTLREMVLVLDAVETRPSRGILNHLMDFKSLTKLTLIGTLATLIFMETILKHCTALEELTINLQFTDNIRGRTYVETWTRRIVGTVSSVKKVTLQEKCRPDQLEYIRFKYPQIDTLIIDVQSIPLAVGRRNMERIIQAMTGVPTYNIKLLIQQENLNDMLGYLFSRKCQFNLKDADHNRFMIVMESHPL
ncbi:hypothetical protein MBANPS3_002135 [Mucor bainieri]